MGTVRERNDSKTGWNQTDLNPSRSCPLRPRMVGSLGAAARIGISCVLNDADGDFRNINELMKRWNHRAKIDRTSDCENYINGDIQFLFEYSGFRNLRGTPLSPIHRRNKPHYVPVVLAEATIDKSWWEIRDLFDKHLGGKPRVISGWDKKLVLVEDIKLVDERQKFVPTRLAMGFQVEKGLIEGWRDPVGE